MKRGGRGNGVPGGTRGRVTAIGLVVAVVAGGGAYWALGGRGHADHAPAEAARGFPRDVVVRLAVERVRPEERPGPVYVALRAKGGLAGQGWSDAEGWQQALEKAIEAALADVRAGPGEVDAVEVNFTYGWQRIDILGNLKEISNAHRGVRGVELTHGDSSVRWSPTAMLARNATFPEVVRRFREAEKLLPEDRIDARLFEARQVLVRLDAEPRAYAMERGNTVVEPEQVTRASVDALARRMGGWMMRNVNEDGRMTYLFYPSRDRESVKNNMIRQFMASLCLVRMSREGFAGAAEKARLNLDYNFKNFYEPEGGLGLIHDRDSVKLGAVALAALAVRESPFREQFADPELRLAALVSRLQKPDGSFRTFFRPEGRTGNDNFYPGEALLYWARAIDESGDAELLSRFMAGFRHYREWHRANRNPAFVPWHTQAYVTVWRRTKAPELRDFVFEMNDWLLSMQQWNEVPYPDMRGRFFDPKRPYGPPHASSTGVYLEGLVDAFELARELGDAARAEAYRRAIVRGLRSVMQLEYGDEVDTYYVRRPDRVLGGIRTTEYDNEIRVDNVQHNLMAILKIRRAFADGDYRPAP